MRRVTAICETGEGATRALKALVEASFPSGDITVLRVTGRQVDEPPIEHRTRIPTTLLGVLAGLGWGKLDADASAEDLERGRLVVGVFVPDERVDHAVAALKRARTDKVIVS